MFNIYCRMMLSSKHLIKTQGLTKQSFDWLIGDIKTRYQRSLVHPGEMVGSIGA